MTLREALAILEVDGDTIDLQRIEANEIVARHLLDRAVFDEHHLRERLKTIGTYTPMGRHLAADIDAQLGELQERRHTLTMALKMSERGRRGG